MGELTTITAPTVNTGCIPERLSRGHKSLWPLTSDEIPLSRGIVNVFAFDLDANPTRLAAFTQTLSCEELQRANRFHFTRDRVRFVTGRGTLRQILALYLQTNPAAVDFTAGAKGKPVLGRGCGGSGLNFNLAHSDGLGVLALALDGPLGVDIERVRGIPEALQLVEMFFSARERTQFENLSEDARPLAFFNLWTRKEAWLKATGEGISEMLHLVEVSFLPGEAPELLRVPAGFGGTGNWHLQSLEPLSGFVGALALPYSVSNYVCRWWPARTA